LTIEIWGLTQNVYVEAYKMDFRDIFMIKRGGKVGGKVLLLSRSTIAFLHKLLFVRIIANSGYILAFQPGKILN
jgi:hypothetical protein